MRKNLSSTSDRISTGPISQRLLRNDPNPRSVMRLGSPALICGLALAMAQVAKASTLVVKVDGFDDSIGQAVLQVHDSSRTFAKDPPRLVRTTAIHNGQAFFVIQDQKPGRYALVAFHDRNRNGIIDHGWTRFPVEPLAFSNGFRPGVLAVMPDFPRLAISVKGSTDTIQLTVREVSASSVFQRNTK